MKQIDEASIQRMPPEKARIVEALVALLERFGAVRESGEEACKYTCATAERLREEG